MSGRELSADEVRQRSEASMRHGARSQLTVRRRAGYCKQSLLMPLGLRQRDLTPAGRYWLDQWAMVEAQTRLFDDWMNERGLIDADGQPPGFSRTYYAARNSASRARSKLEPYLVEAAERMAPAVSALDRHLESRYSR